MQESTFVLDKSVNLFDKFDHFTCPPDRSHIEVFDPALKGFYVDVLASGRKSFRLRYRLNTRVRQQIPIFPVFAYPASTKSSTYS